MPEETVNSGESQPTETTTGNDAMTQLEAKYDEILKETPAEEKPAETKETEQTTQTETAASEPAGTGIESPKGDEYADIPDEQTSAGRAFGLTDETIVKLAEDSPDALKALASAHKQISRTAAAVEKPAETPKEERFERIEVGNLDLLDDTAKQTIEKVVDSHNKLVDRLNTINEKVSVFDQKVAQTEAQRQAEFDAKIDSFFDTSEIPTLGKTGTINPKQQAARKECYEVARVLLGSSNGNLEVALSKAVKAYKGLYDGSEKAAENTLRKKLDRNKQRFTARPGGQKTSATALTEKERVEDTLKEKTAEYGLKW